MSIWRHGEQKGGTKILKPTPKIIGKRWDPVFSQPTSITPKHATLILGRLHGQQEMATRPFPAVMCPQWVGLTRMWSLLLHRRRPPVRLGQSSCPPRSCREDLRPTQTCSCAHFDVVCRCPHTQPCFRSWRIVHMIKDSIVIHQCLSTCQTIEKAAHHQVVDHVLKLLLLLAAHVLFLVPIERG